jgi:hypothetical protein
MRNPYERAQQTQVPQAQSPATTRPDGYDYQIIEALQRELSGVHRRMGELESKVRRYDRAFESMFKEELDRRVNGKSGEDCGACEVSPLERLKWEAQKTAQRYASGGLSGSGGLR